MAAVDEYRAVVNNRSGKHGHLSESDHDTMRAACSEAEDWFRTKQMEQAELARTADPVLKVAEIEAKRTALVRELKPIASKPVPPPTPAPTPAPAPAPAASPPAAAASAGAPAPAPATGTEPAAAAATAAPSGGSAPMDEDASAGAVVPEASPFA